MHFVMLFRLQTSGRGTLLPGPEGSFQVKKKKPLDEKALNIFPQRRNY
jgi:hypothetical protein